MAPGTDGRVVKAEDLSPSAVMRVGSIPTLCIFYYHFTPFSLVYNTNMENRIAFSSDNEKHLNAYIEYCNLVGDHGGKMMDEKEYE